MVTRRKHSHRTGGVAPGYPERTCLGCLERDRKSAMVRLAAHPGGGVEPDFEARAAGRGGYLHPRTECLGRFVKSRVREFRSLRRGLDRAGRLRITETIEARLDTNRKLK